MRLRSESAARIKDKIERPGASLPAFQFCLYQESRRESLTIIVRYAPILVSARDFVSLVAKPHRSGVAHRRV